MAVLELLDVTFKYQLAKETILENISLSIEKGEFIALVGRNGVGKTTLCSIMRGLIPTFHTGTMSGKVLLNGLDINEMSIGDLALHIGFVFQNPFVQVSGVKQTVFEEVAYGLENLGVERSEIIRRVEVMLQQLNIEHLRSKHPMQLSGGQSQRVALASVLVMDPEILIIDEPTSQLDPQGTEEVFETIRLLKERKKTIILVEHKVDWVAEYADRVIVINDKHIVKDASTSEVFSDPMLLNTGNNLPHVALLALRLQELGKVNFDLIPTTLDEAYDQLKGREQ
ncbi:MAG: ABC transporter ATP-binding protein [Erysipelotrichaceae bacterium]|nr:ABC transporter ATP-binding protein [Erysipelotrichaceae bacterium]MDP3306534.1 ABC transporter ATP-binding protein [Erysipelotrichaceae bacterium]